MHAERDLRARIEEVPYWWHSIDLGDGAVTPGRKPIEELESPLCELQLPDRREDRGRHRRLGRLLLLRRRVLGQPRA
jgi:hypothetical protein